MLALLYFATEGESWDNDHNFLGPLSECEWHNAFNQGVFCNDFGRVTDVRLGEFKQKVGLPMFCINWFA